MKPDRQTPVIGVVGPCTSGKSTLIRNLAPHGIFLRHIAQEHSYVQTMWQRLTDPDLLIFLDVSYAISQQRKKLNWNENEYREQQNRLAHARAHCDFYLDTDSLTPAQVASQVAAFVRQRYPLLSASQ